MTKQARIEKGERLEGGKSVLRSALFALLFTPLASALALLVAASFFSLKPESSHYIGTVGCTLGAASAFFGGFLSGRRQRHAGALAGVLFGILFTILLAVIGKLFGGGSPLQRVIGYAVFLLLSALGGMLGTVKSSKGHHKRRRR